jgi:peroxiredoxin
MRRASLPLVFACLLPLSAAAQETGGLTVEPAAPRPGGVVRVEYRADSALAGAERLVLRARLRTPHDGAYGRGTETRRVAELVRGADGRFRARVRLPDSVVYAVLAVESADGGRVDTHGGRGWPLLLHTPAGVPLSAALDQRTQDLTGRDWPGALAAARERARLYPDDPDSWSSLRFFEEAALGPAGASAAEAEHRARFAGFERRYSADPRVGPARASAMLFYAWGVKENEAADRWKARLVREHPASPDAVQLRVGEIVNRHRQDPAARLRALETLWTEVGAAHPYVVRMGLDAARAAGDVAALRAWAARSDRHAPDSDRAVAALLAGYPATRPEGMRRLRAALARVGEHRALLQTAAAARAAAGADSAALLASLGRALLASGAVRAGLDTLGRAAEWSTDTELLGALAEARLAAADTAGAAEAWARVAANPGVPAARADSLRRRVGEHGGPDRWPALVARGRARLREAVLRAGVSRALPAGLALADASGSPVPLVDAGAPTVLVFWSRGCYPSVEALPGVQRLAEALAGAGVRVLAVTDEDPAEAPSRFARERGLRTVPVLHDTRREASLALGAAGTPSFFVVDRSGMLRFEWSSPDDVPLQVEALRAEAPR